MNTVQKYLPYATFVLILFIFLKGCGTGSQVKSTDKKIEILTHKVDSLSNIVVTQEEMINTLENTTMWQTLVIEELSDKDHMPINHLLHGLFIYLLVLKLPPCQPWRQFQLIWEDLYISHFLLLP